MAMVPVERGRLWAEWAGDGTGIALLHSALADARMWDPQWASVTDRHRVVRCDLRGFGRSEGEVDGYSPRRDLADVLDAAGIGSAVLVGSSMGGGVAIDAALEFPGRVAGVVWVGGGLGGLERDDTPQEAEADARMGELGAAKAWPELADLGVRVFVDGLGQPAGRAPQPAREAIRRMYLDLLVAERPQRHPIALDPPAAGRLRELGVPVLVVVGLLDSPWVLAAASALAEGAPCARRIDVPGAAHFPSLEQPGWFADALRAFAGEVAAGG